MADDVIETLAKLKPTAPDRDAILFAAGRASARRSPIWKWLTIGLIVSNAVLFTLWLLPDKTPGHPVMPLPSDEDFLRTDPERPSPSSDRPASLLNFHPPVPESVPTSSVVPEQHWTARTDPFEFRLD